jgi:hypothetical protein
MHLLGSLANPLIMPNSPTERAAASPLWILGVILQLGLAGTVFVLSRTAMQPDLGGVALLAMLALSVPYLIALIRVGRVPPQAAIRGIVIFALFFRVTAVCAPALLSADVHRSLWEGRAQTFGHNPYRVTPAEPAVAFLAPELLSKLAAPDLPATTAPLAELVFRVAATIWPHGPLLIKAMFAGLDLAVMWVLIRLLRLRKIPETAVLIYAWNPLPIIEFAAHGHPQPLGMFLGLVTIYLAKAPPKKRWAGSFEQAVAALSVGGAALSSWLAAPLLLLMRAQIRLRFWLLWVLVLAVFWLPFQSAGWQLFEGAFRAANEGRFHFNSLVFDGVAWLAGAAGLEPALACGALTVSTPLVIVAGAWLLLFIGAVVARADPLRAFYLLSAAWLLFSPAVAPRDVAWILPFLCFYRNSGWLLLGAGVLLSYATPVVELQTGVRVELLEVKLLEYVPAFVLMGWSAIASYAVPAVAHEIRRGQR